jgi:hypothetical protein
MNLLGTPLALTVARRNVKQGTYSFELKRRLYACITEETGISTSTICVITVEEREKNSTHKSSTALTA